MYAEFPNPLANVNADTLPAPMSNEELAKMETHGHPMINELRKAVRECVEIPFEFTLKGEEGSQGETIIVHPKYRPSSRGRGKRRSATIAELEKMVQKRHNSPESEKARRTREMSRNVETYAEFWDSVEKTERDEYGNANPAMGIPYVVNEDKLIRNEQLFAKLLGIEVDEDEPRYAAPNARNNLLHTTGKNHTLR